MATTAAAIRRAPATATIHRLEVPGAGQGPAPDMIKANMAALAAYGGRSMTDPTLRARLGKLDLPVRVIWGLPQVEAPEELLGRIGDLDRH